MSKRKRRRLRRPIRKFLFFVCLIIIGGFIVFNYFSFGDNKNSVVNKMVASIDKYLESRNKKLEEYNKCLDFKYTDEDLTDELKKVINETDSFFSKYSASIGYVEPVTNFSYKYNENRKYYAASTIKMLDALYLYENAAEGKVDLDEKMTYTSKYLRGASLKMGSKKYGDKVKLRDLVSYAVIYSDNIAHAMLLDYIGKANLRDYGKSLGAKYTLNSDDFGEITVDDALVYLNALNKYLNTDTEDAKELKSYFVDSQQNYLNFPDDKVDAVQKYGEYPGYYHENGIVYVEKPYLVTILTNYGNNEKIIRNLNSKVLELHNKFFELRGNKCIELLK